MNSAELPPSFHFPTETSQWDDVRRIYRRICLLRATGRGEEASDLQNTEFSRALSAARDASSSGVKEASLLAAEAERVSAACMLAELVAPLLAERLRAEPGFAASSVVTASSSANNASASSPSRAPGTPVPGIADLIDGMLSLDHAFAAGRTRP